MYPPKAQTILEGMYRFFNNVRSTIRAKRFSQALKIELEKKDGSSMVNAYMANINLDLETTICNHLPHTNEHFDTRNSIILTSMLDTISEKYLHICF